MIRPITNSNYNRQSYSPTILILITYAVVKQISYVESYNNVGRIAVVCNHVTQGFVYICL